MIEQGSKVAFDYDLTVEGQNVDSSQGKQPLQYTQGQKQIIPGLEKELLGLKVGDEKSVVVSPKEGYGEMNPEAFREVKKSTLPAGFDPQVGMMLSMRGKGVSPMPVKISEVKEDSVILDLNHPLAGKTLNFKVKIVSIE